MASYQIHLLGQHQPLHVDLPYADLGDLMMEATRAKFLIGHMVEADEEGVCRAIMIATYRIQCVLAAG